MKKFALVALVLLFVSPVFAGRLLIQLPQQPGSQDSISFAQFCDQSEGDAVSFLRFLVERASQLIVGRAFEISANRTQYQFVIRDQVKHGYWIDSDELALGWEEGKVNRRPTAYWRVFSFVGKNGVENFHVKLVQNQTLTEAFQNSALITDLYRNVMKQIAKKEGFLTSFAISVNDAGQFVVLFTREPQPN